MTTLLSSMIAQTGVIGNWAFRKQSYAMRRQLRLAVLAMVFVVFMGGAARIQLAELGCVNFLQCLLHRGRGSSAAKSGGEGGGHSTAEVVSWPDARSMHRAPLSSERLSVGSIMCSVAARRGVTRSE